MSHARRIILLVAIALLMLTVVATTASPALAAPPSSTQWTYAVYCDADNNLEPYWDQYSLAWLLEVPASPDVVIVAMQDRLSADGTELIEISGGQRTVVATYPEKNFGDGATFAWFLETVDARYPSTNLAVTMWDHGYAWRYICMDDTSDGDRITMDELRAAIVGADVPIDILAFDACNMGSVDVAYEAALTGLVDIMVASEESVPYNGFPYDEMLTPLAQDPSRTPEQVAADMVAGWKHYYETLNWANGVQLAAIDVTEIADAVPDLQQWTARLAAGLPLYKKDYSAALKKSWLAWATNHYDLGGVCANLAADPDIADPALQGANQAVLDHLSSALIAQSVASGSAAATGLTIWWNTKVDWTYYQGAYKTQVAFAQPAPLGVGWWDFLSAYAGR